MPDKESDYKELGFMCGLEIHQRLATSEKLFCSCPSALPSQEEKAPAVIRRYQRAVAGELGVVDRAAKFEEEKGREFVYRVNAGHTCLVDLDEEPPHAMNAEALSIALSVAKAMAMSIPEEVQPMRKQVVDGSNPSGFQRTTKIGMNGSLSVNGRKIAITSAFLEEESAGIEDSEAGETVYETSRIGIPLMEIDTDPYLASPAEAKEAALRIGTVLRLTGRVQRGIGSIRQDVNVSIRGGARVEIKGLQDLSSLDRFVENEVVRQQRLIAIRAELAGRKSVSVGDPMEVTGALRSTKAKMIESAIAHGGVVIGLALHGFAGALGMEVNPDRRLGSEISDYARMGGVKGLIHSDEDLSKYGLARGELAAVASELGLGHGDAFILIAGNRAAASIAARFASLRARAAVETGVLPETRAAVNNDLFTTRFLRPLPGVSRMYPETDASPIRITRAILTRAAAAAPDLEGESARLLKELASAPLAAQMLLSPRLPLYREITAATGADKAFVANTLLQRFTELRRAGYNADGISARRLIELFSEYASGAVTKAGVEELLKSLSSKDGPVGERVEALGIRRVTAKALAGLVAEASGQSPRDKAGRAELARLIMSKHRLNVDGEELNRLLEEVVG